MTSIDFCVGVRQQPFPSPWIAPQPGLASVLPDRHSGHDPELQLLTELLRRCPSNVVVLPRIKMKGLDVISAAGPHNGDPQPEGEPCLEIDTRPLPGEIA